MSMDLYLWKSPVTGDPDEAGALVDRYFDGDEAAFVPDPAIAMVADALRALYPYRILSNEQTVAALSEEERGQYTPEALKEITSVEGGAPWADLPFDESDRMLALSIRWSADGEVLDDIVRLGREHDLVIYDPQGPSVYLPDDPTEMEPVPPPGLRELVTSLAIAAALSGLTYAAWLIPIGWIRWPAVIVSGFVAAAALFVLGIVIGGMFGWIKAEE